MVKTIVPKKISSLTEKLVNNTNTISKKLLHKKLYKTTHKYKEIIFLLVVIVLFTLIWYFLRKREGHQSVEPENQSVEPENQSVEPENQSVEPENQSVEPENQSVEPEQNEIDEDDVIEEGFESYSNENTYSTYSNENTYSTLV